MYSILLVDDEQYIRQSIIELVQWEKKGFFILGEASNGEEALEIMSKNVPDILITDIRMPVMNGIELTKRIREKHPSVKIVFLSGHDDFDYAVSGIKLNIIEYLLKPISIKDLEKMLDQVREILIEEKREANDLKRIETNYLENFQGIKMSFLVSLITDNYKEVPEEEIQKLVETYRLNLTGNRNVLLNVNIDKSTLNKSQLENHNLEMMKFSLANVTRKISSKYLGGEVFNFTSNIVVMLSDTKENIDLYKDIIVREISETIKKLFHFSVGIGVSEEYNSLSDARLSFQSSISALNYGMLMKKNKEVYISDIETSGLEKMVFDESNETKLISLIKIASKEELLEFIDELFQGLEKDNETHLQIFLMELYVSVLKAYKSVIPIYDTNMLQRIQMISDIHYYQEIEEIRDWFKEFCLTVVDSIHLQRKKKTDSLAKKSYDYLVNNYNDPALSLKLVSKKMAISPSYFSSLFKKENGISFTNALIKIRMEKAKEHLLTTDCKIIEVALASGYTDQHYFSYCFKKYFGESPNKIRESFKEKELLV